MNKCTWDGALSSPFVLVLLSMLGLGGCGDLVPPPPLATKYVTMMPGGTHSTRLLVVFTYGFGCFADGRGNGLRDTADAVHRQFVTSQVITRGWNDDDGIEQIIQAHQGPVVLVGHSFGGCRSVEIAENVHRSVDELILLDPVPFRSWASRHGGKQFELPSNVGKAVCFHRPATFWPLSYSLVHPSLAWENRVRDLGHAEFCDNNEVRRCVLEACARETARLEINDAAQASIQ